MPKKKIDDEAQATLLGDTGDTEAVADEAAVSFGAAMEELEGILRRIEEEETDIDRLAGELRRATVLLETARGQLRKAEVEVTQIVQTLESSPTAPKAPEETSDSDDDGDDDIPF